MYHVAIQSLSLVISWGVLGCFFGPQGWQDLSTNTIIIQSFQCFPFQGYLGHQDSFIFCCACFYHLCWIISTRHQDPIIPGGILWHNFLFCRIFNSFEYISSNLRLMLSSLTTLTTSPTQFIRNPLGTITRVPAAYFQLFLRCPLQLLQASSRALDFPFLAA